MVYGPWSLGDVSVVSFGVPGISMEKPPSSEMNLTQPGGATGGMFLRGALGVLGVGLDGRGECS